VGSVLGVRLAARPVSRLVYGKEPQPFARLDGSPGARFDYFLIGVVRSSTVVAAMTLMVVDLDSSGSKSSVM
jgi:hypothetical protein